MLYSEDLCHYSHFYVFLMLLSSRNKLKYTYFIFELRPSLYSRACV